MMLLNRPLQMLAVAAGAGSMLLAALSSAALAQRPTYRAVSHRDEAPYCAASYGHPCPCPCPAEQAGPADQVPAPEDGETDLPEVADVMPDSAFASAPQSAVPNAIGDSMGGCLSAFTFGGIFPSAEVPVCTAFRRFRISENNSALPQHRVYYNYHYFDNALRPALDGESVNIDVQRHEFGLEYPFWYNMASVGVETSFSHTLNRELDTTDVDLRDVEFGNVSIYLKGILYQDCCKTLSAGLGIDLPTADDVRVATDTDAFAFDNDVVVLSPYLALLVADPCSNLFVHSFVQVDFPTDEYGFTFNGTGGQIDDATVLYVDGSVGYWLQRDCCGNGIAAIAELHWTTNLEGNATITDGVNTISRTDFDFLNATIGANIARGCWDVRPAVVLPLLDRPDRQFDWELALQVNRRF